MKSPYRKSGEGKRADDDSLFGLLSSYKSYNTYISLYVSDKDESILLFITDNPKKWSLLSDERYKDYRPLKRLEIGITKLSIKYLLPEHLIKSIGPMLGMKLPSNRVRVVNNIDRDGYFILECPRKYLQEVVHNIRRIINMPPQKKYEILEKCLAENV